MQGIELLCKLNNRLGQYQTVLENADNHTDRLILADIPIEVDITRKQAAIIIHEYLRCVLHEDDDRETSLAKELKDLYDCRICVKHIEQVYVKGIMEAMIDLGKSKETGLPIIFGGNELLTDEEASKIVERVVNKEFRISYSNK